VSRLAALRSIGSSNGSVGCLRQCHGFPRGQLGHGPQGSRSSGARAPQLQTMDHATPRGVAWSLSGILPSALTPESSCVVSFDIQGTSASRRQDRAACRGTQVALFFCVRLLFALRFPRTCRGPMRSRPTATVEPQPTLSVNAVLTYSPLRKKRDQERCQGCGEKVHPHKQGRCTRARHSWTIHHLTAPWSTKSQNSRSLA